MSVHASPISATCDFLRQRAILLPECLLTGCQRPTLRRHIPTPCNPPGLRHMSGEIQAKFSRPLADDRVSGHV